MAEHVPSTESESLGNNGLSKGSSSKKQIGLKQGASKMPFINGNSKGKAKKSTKKVPQAGEEWRGKKRLFPQNSLEESLKVPLAIKEKNGGNAWSPDEVASACGMSPKTNEFYYLSASAQSYGLTSGTRNSSEISITDFGREIVYPESAEEQQRKKVDAFLMFRFSNKFLNTTRADRYLRCSFLAAG